MSSRRHIATRRGSPDAVRAPEHNAVGRGWKLCLFLGALCAFPQTAWAQLQYTNSTDGAVNESVTPCTNPLVRNFAVSQIYTVADVNIGVLMAHTYRGDVRFYLQSPAGTRVQLINNIGTTRNNVNVLFDDAASNPISSHTSNNDSATAGTTVPPYQRTFRPFQALSAFNGQEAAGTWRLEVCDSLNADSGTFYQSDLFLTAAPASIGVTKISSVINAMSTAATGFRSHDDPPP
jgi:subtilisin-like proprotein convertase family protein